VAIAGRLESGDFNRDDRSDLLISDDTSYVVSFETASESPRITAAPKSENVFTVADMNSDGYSDYISDLDLRLVALTIARGTPSGELLVAPNPVALPKADTYKMFTVGGLGPRDGEFYLVADRTVYRFPAFSFPSSGVASESVFLRLFELEGTLSDAPVGALPWSPGPIASGRFDLQATRDCQEFVVPINPGLGQTNPPKVVIYSPCQMDGYEVSRVEFPPGFPAAQPITRVLVGDLQPDGNADLLIKTLAPRTSNDDPERELIFFAYGVGDGTFDSRRTPPAEKGDGHVDLTPIGMPPGTELTYAGALNDHPAVDFLVSGVTWRSSPNPSDECFGVVGYECGPCTLFKCRWFPTWFETGDFTGDSVPDMVSPVGDSRDVAFWMGAPDGIFRGYELPTSGVVSARDWSGNIAAKQSTVADFDGDRIMDFAFTERASRDSTDASATIYYGQPFAAPKDSFNTGPLGNILEIASTPVYGFRGSAAALAVLSRSDDSSETRATVYLGQSNRQPLSPIVAPGLNEGLSLQLLAGTFRAGQHRDLVLITEGATLADQRLLKHVFSDGPGYRMPTAADPIAAMPRDFLFTHWLGFVLDLDADGIDELALWGTDEKRLHVRLAVARFKQNTWAFDPTLVVADNGAPLEDFFVIPLAAQNADVDGDKRPDIYGMAMINDAPTLVLYLSGSNKPLAKDALVHIPAPGLSAAPIWLNADADAAQELVLFRASNIEIYDIDLSSRSMTLKSTMPGPAGEIRSARSGDFNGDGVSDFAYVDNIGAASSGNVQIVWGQAVK
jgi:hypothetical protein